MLVLLYRLTICLVLLWGLLGCQSLDTKKLDLMPVQYPKKERLEFTGRGGAAAMMMSGTMGAMGIAIGVAIDEGIAKDLHASASRGGFDAKAVVSGVLRRYGFAVQHFDEKESTRTEMRRHLAIQHLGFRSAGDQITPWVEVTLVEGSSVKSMTYKELVGEQAATAELNDLRAQHKQTADMLTAALQQVIAALWE